MKWFQHLSDSHNDPEMVMLIEEYGMRGYGICWVCRELVGKFGDKYRIKASKNWKKLLKKASLEEETFLDEVLSFMAQKNIVNRKSFKDGDLHIPKMSNYSDDYTKRLRTRNEQCSSTLHYITLDKITLDNIIEQYIKTKGLSLHIKEYPEYQSEIYRSQGRAVKRLYVALNKNCEAVCQAIDRIGRYFNERRLDWNLYTICKHLDKGMGGKTLKDLGIDTGKLGKDVK